MKGQNLRVQTSRLKRSLAGYVQEPSEEYEHPVGYIFISSDSTNPETVLGYGTWVLIGTGQLALV